MTSNDITDPEEVRVFADYNSWPLWHGINNVPVDSLGIEGELAGALNRWAEVYSATLDDGYPPDSGFATALEYEMWVLWGQSLAQRVADVLGRSVIYCNMDNSDGRERWLKLRPTAK